jgi:hypothetical protein
MKHRIITLVLLTGLAYGLIMLASAVTSARLPDNHQDYAPVQPVAYSHRLHAGELGIECRFCHSAADHGKHAGIPSGDVCLKCHKFVTSSFDVLQAELSRAEKEQRKPEVIVSDKIRQMYDFLKIRNPQDAPTDPAAGIPWVRVHNLPDFVAFDHRSHVAAGVTCQKCHGAVESMERIRQAESLSMGWCVNCHREATEKGIDGHAVNASLNCTTCHY